MVKASAFVIYVLPIVLSVSLGTAVMAETLNSPDRELNFLQFDDEVFTSDSKNEINLIGFQNQISQNSNLEFSINISNSNFNCGDLYITIYDVTTEKQILTQSGYLKQCFMQNNNTLPVDEIFSELIDQSGTYEIYIEIFDKTYSKSINMVEILRVI